MQFLLWSQDTERDSTAVPATKYIRAGIAVKITQIMSCYISKIIYYEISKVV